MPTVFTKIINREIPAFIILEDANYIAFLDINPLVLGHTLVVPKKEVDFIFDLDDETLAGLNVFAKKVAHAIKKAVPCKRIDSMGDLNFTRSKLSPAKTELEEIAKKIQQAL
jgi:histidine triad (HIT) family protein